MTVRDALKRGAPCLEELLLRLLPEENRFPPLFIVGAPRCGTTIVSLHLINNFRFSYFPNASKHNPRCPLLAACWARLREQYEPTTESRYGIVDGPMAPSDGWDIFHRWFPRYDHSEPVSTESLNELRRMVFFLERLMGGPFANKNNNNATRIRELSGLFPRSLFIHVRRAPRDAIASLIRARRDNSVAPDQWWGVAPPQSYDSAATGTIERSVVQICEVDDHIRNSLEEISDERHLEVRYESFCEQPDRLEEEIEDTYTGLKVDLERRMKEQSEADYTASKSWGGLSTPVREQVEEMLSRHCS